MELKASDHLTTEQRSTVEEILRHYPTGREIKQWAKECAKRKVMFGAMMAPEDPAVFSGEETAIPDFLPRGRTTPVERTHALLSAYELFRFGLVNADNLKPELRRQIPYVLRHFPGTGEINSWSRQDAWDASKDTTHRQWLAPESSP